MILFLNGLFIVMSVFFMIGRLYEINSLTDFATNFITGQPVVTTPLMIALVCIMATCCGIIIFAADKGGKKIRSIPVGILGIMAGVFFIAGGIVNSVNCFKYGGFILYHGMQILGGLGFMLLGIMNIKGKKKEAAPVVMTMLIPIGVCMNSVLHEIKPVADTDFMYRSLAGIFTLIFILLLVKSVYAYDKYSKILLYTASLINFVVTGIGSLCAVIGRIITSTVDIPQLFYNVGFIFVGVYSLFVAFYILPSKTASVTEYETDSQVKKPKPVQKKRKKEVNTNDYYDTSTMGNISITTINELFAKKDAGENITEKVYNPTTVVKNNKSFEAENILPDTEKTTIISQVKTKPVAEKTTVKKTIYKANK